MSTTGTAILQLDMFSGRCTTSGALFVPVDFGRSYALGFADGAVFGTAQGVRLGYSLGLDDAEIVPAGSSGLAQGLAAGRVRGADDSEDDAASDAASIAFPMGLASAPTGGETTPPVVGTVAPTANTEPGDAGGFSDDFPTAAVTPIVIPVLDAASTVAFVALSALYAGRQAWETVYVGRPAIDGVAGFRLGYTLASAISGTGDPGVGFTFSLRKDAGWPGDQAVETPVQIDIMAVDSKGNVLP